MWALARASLALRRHGPSETTRLLGRVDDGEPSEAAVAAPREALRVGRAVEGVARVLPWRPACLPQAIATRAMLARRGIPSRSHLGVVSTDEFAGHAWVTVGGMVVQGGGSRATRLATFR
jgi:hypothetical protein